MSKTVEELEEEILELKKALASCFCNYIGDKSVAANLPAFTLIAALIHNDESIIRRRKQGELLPEHQREDVERFCDMINEFGGGGMPAITKVIQSWLPPEEIKETIH